MCILFLSFFQACDSFEEAPLDILTDDTVWDTQDSLGIYAQRYLYGIYLQLPTLHNRIGNDYLDSGTDDGMSSIDKKDDGSVNSFRSGAISTRNVVDGGAWNKNYTGIRRANVLLANIDKINLNEALKGNKVQWKAEARFLRAFFYFELIKRWGGVPLVGDKVFGIDDKVDIPRNTIDECINYILSELDAVYDDLFDPKGLADLNIGRANKGAVNALRSRLLLYIASPLYNKNGDIQKWKDAASAAKQVIDMNTYSLHSSFKTLFYTIKNPESIFLFESGQSTSVETNNGPIGYQSTSYKLKGYTSPSQNLVDAFLTIEGKKINDPDSKYDPQKPYNDRDPRLALTVFLNGSPWLKRKVEVYEGGLDKPNGNQYQTKTGYYLRKFMGAYENSDNVANTHHSYIIFRYAEILLNYAESLNESDPTGSKLEIEDALKDIRKRAGIEEGSNNRYGIPEVYSQDEMRDIIRNERRIELAFEEHRFWDIRRWETAEVVMNEPIKGVIVTKQKNGTFKYEVKDIQNSVFDKNRMYWLPIPYSEIKANPNMVQNPGWNY